MIIDREIIRLESELPTRIIAAIKGEDRNIAAIIGAQK
jgi:hypothetical protein